jgi:ABC-type branched-subunit amino acid transport system permease subunit
MIDKIFEWLFAVIVVLALLPCIVSIVVHTLGPILLAIVMIAIILGVYRSYERARRHTTRSRGSMGSERTPVFPREDE